MKERVRKNAFGSDLLLIKVYNASVTAMIGLHPKLSLTLILDSSHRRPLDH